MKSGGPLRLSFTFFPGQHTHCSTCAAAYATVGKRYRPLAEWERPVKGVCSLIMITIRLTTIVCFAWAVIETLGAVFAALFTLTSDAAGGQPLRVRPADRRRIVRPHRARFGAVRHVRLRLRHRRTRAGQRNVSSALSTRMMTTCSGFDAIFWSTYAQRQCVYEYCDRGNYERRVHDENEEVETDGAAIV